jgi:hypothetical protein
VSKSITALKQKALDMRGIKGVTRLTLGPESNRSGFGAQKDISIRGVDQRAALFGEVNFKITDHLKMTTNPPKHSSTERSL